MDIKIFNHGVAPWHPKQDEALGNWKCSKCRRPVRRDARAVAAVVVCAACQSVDAPVESTARAPRREWIA
jgi:hypothetical protein